jgi:hypothetical protein
VNRSAATRYAEDVDEYHSAVLVIHLLHLCAHGQHLARVGSVIGAASQVVSLDCSGCQRSNFNEESAVVGWRQRFAVAAVLDELPPLFRRVMAVMSRPAPLDVLLIPFT